MTRNLLSFWKKKLLLGVLLLSAFAGKAQIDITAIQATPTNGQTITGGQSFSVSLAVKNNSTTTDIKSTDIFVITCYVDRGTKKDTLGCGTFTGPFLAIPKGGTAGPFSVSCKYNVPAAQTNAKICQSVYLKGQTDPKPADNIACATVNLVVGGGTGGHNTGTPQFAYLGTTLVNNAIPFQFAANNKMQALYASSDLKNSSGKTATSGSISKVYLRTTGASDIFNITNVSVKMGQSADTKFSSTTFVTGLTQVFASPSYSVSSPGWIEFTLQTPFKYDNTKSLIVEFTGNDGFAISQERNFGVERRLFGGVSATSGTVDKSLPEFGIDLGGTAVDDVENNIVAVQVFPNPAIDEVTFVTSKYLQGKVILYDLAGKVVANTTIGGNTVTLPVSQLAKGLYIYSVVSNEGLTVAKGKLSVGQ